MKNFAYDIRKPDGTVVRPTIKEKRGNVSVIPFRYMEPGDKILVPADDPLTELLPSGHNRCTRIQRRARDYAAKTRRGMRAIRLPCGSVEITRLT